MVILRETTRFVLIRTEHVHIIKTAMKEIEGYQALKYKYFKYVFQELKLLCI